MCRLCSCHSAFEHAYSCAIALEGRLIQTPPTVFTEMSLFPARLPLEINFPPRSIMVSYFALRYLPFNSFIHFLDLFIFCEISRTKDSSCFKEPRTAPGFAQARVLAGKLHKWALCSRVCIENSQVGLCHSYFRPGF